MINKKSLSLLIFCILAVLFTLTFTACSSDDDPTRPGENTPEVVRPEDDPSLGPLEWHAVTTSPEPGSIFAYFITDVTYGKGKFVAVGGKGTIAYSADGITWTAVEDSKFPETSFDGNYIYAIGYGGATGNEKFIAGGDEGNMVISSDGVTWEAVEDSKLGNEIYAIAYGNGKFVAGDNGGNMAYSTDDGTTWVLISSTFGNGIWDITYGDGMFVAVGMKSVGHDGFYGGFIAYSNNGIDWTDVSDSADLQSPILAIAYGNGIFVAVGEDGETVYSTDGASWETATNIFGTNEIFGIAYGNDKFIAVGWEGMMATSADGIKWEEITPGDEEGTSMFITKISAIAFDGNERFVAVGYDDDYRGVIAYTTGY